MLIKLIKLEFQAPSRPGASLLRGDSSNMLIGICFCSICKSKLFWPQSVKTSVNQSDFSLPHLLSCWIVVKWLQAFLRSEAAASRIHLSLGLVILHMCVRVAFNQFCVELLLLKGLWETKEPLQGKQGRTMLY